MRYYIFLIFLFPNIIFSQNLYWPSDYLEISTDNNHTIMFSLSDPIILNDQQLDEGSLIGSFYTNENGDLICGGFTSYNHNENFSAPVYSDDALTDEIDGFTNGQEMFWLVNSNGIDYLASVSYLTGPETFISNGITVISSVQISSLLNNDNMGCTDSLSINYDLMATMDDGSCLYDIEGCTDSLSNNYDLMATIDDGSCLYDIEGCMDPNYIEYDVNAIQDSQPSSCLTLVVLGCTIDIALNFNSLANTNDGSCILSNEGCMDPNYVEYNSEASIDDGSCQVFVIYGCTDNNYLEYTPVANSDDGSCVNQIILGCTDINYLEFDINANVDDGSCSSIIISGCTNSNFIEYNSEATLDDGSCNFEVLFGCMDSLANNYNPLANTDNNLCEYYGCTDPSAFNYNANANIEDNSCVEVLFGCTNSNYLEYDSSANINDGSCLTLIILGCTNPNSFNYNFNANTDDGTCIEIVEGCTDSLYFEYNPNANLENGDCSNFIIQGCTDPEAYNYTNANYDDGSCIYDLILFNSSFLGGSTYEFSVDVLYMEGYSVIWNFGDGQISTLEQVTHVFNENGNFTVTLTVTNGLLAIVEQIDLNVNFPNMNIIDNKTLFNEVYYDIMGNKVNSNSNKLKIRVRKYNDGKIEIKKLINIH